jgi:hypothetical protein
MNTNLNQQINTLNAKHLEELQLFIEFLLVKQETNIEPKRNKQKRFFADINPIDIPVSKYVIQRDEIYENRI